MKLPVAEPKRCVLPKSESEGFSAEEILVMGIDEPAVLLNPNNGLVISNQNAKRVEHLFYDEVDGELSRFGSSANDTGQIVSASITLSTIAGQVVYHVSVIPLILGRNVLYLFQDLTLDHNLRDALIESRQRFKDLVEVSSDFSWEVGADGCFHFVSRTGALGYVSDDFIGHSPEEFIVGAEDFDANPFHTQDVVDNVELWMHARDGSMACVMVSAMPFKEEDGTILGVRGVCRDVTRERERETALAQAYQREQVLGYIVNSIREEINPIDMLGAATAATARAMGAKGCAVLRKQSSKDETNSSASNHFIRAAEFGTGGPAEFDNRFLAFEPGDRMLHENTIDGWNVIAGPCQHAGIINGVICLWRKDGWSDDARILVSDIAGQLGIAIEQISNHESIVRLSRTDAMTGLLNRRAFYEDELPRRFNRLALDDASGALFFIDMDNFKMVNDIHGHQVGDDAINALRDILHDFVRPGDLIARLGGDEFALWMDGNVNDKLIQTRCQELLKASKILHKFSGNDEKPLDISVGIAVYNHSTGETLEGLLARADEAMYEVKNNKKGGYHLAPAAIQAIQ